MYPENTSTRVSEEFLSKTLCGISRPGHFQGVTTVVAKLFNAALPDIAVFGRKDAQQALIIKRIVRDLNFPVEIIIAPIIRESDGLAMSSRNKYLSKDERERALSISRSLKKGVSFVKNGSVKSPGELINLITAEIASAQGRIDYVEVVRMTDLRPAEDFRAPCLVAAAAFFGNTRLIDNETIE
jgi:pantoate--beta-alanine ligase